jgi:pimeloyl-ACP methyl ester carboxylesterase
MDRRSFAIQINGEATELSGLWVRGFRLLPGAGDKDRAVHDASASSRGAAHPVVDSSVNAVRGAFGPDRYVSDASSGQRSTMIEQSGLFYKAASRWGGWLAMLREDDNFGMSLELTNGSSGPRTINLCERRRESQFRHELADASVREVRHLVNTTVGNYETRSLLYGGGAPDSKARNLVVYYHGGPASTIYDQPFPRLVKTLLSNSTDILAVDYPSSAGLQAPFADYQRRGVSAIEDGVRAVHSWISKNAHYRNVYIIGESFGAVPALISRRQYPALAANYFMLAPMIKVPPLSAAGRAAGVSAESQRIFEVAVFGEGDRRARFDADLQSLVVDQPRRTNVTFLFGANDGLSDRSSLGPLEALASREVIVVPGANHQLLSSKDSVLDLINGRVNGAPR